MRARTARSRSTSTIRMPISGSSMTAAPPAFHCRSFRA
jgi:hypothetical protein